MEQKIRARQNWLRIYEQTDSVTKTALRCGIARTTLYRWIKRSKEEGKSGLSDKSKRPPNIVNTKVTSDLESIILNLRKKKRGGSQRISSYLLPKKITLSTMTVLQFFSKPSGKASCKAS